ncbi:addiction module protein [Aeromicrobium sp.]|uniref:addiction module protein n=1 Tax=Aeromicrobium sp. TaxID=1871063 RepID=UPI003C64B91B
MSLSASEFFEARMSLPPSVREDVALRLLESLEAVGQETVAESWTAEIGSRVEEMVSGDVQMVRGEDVFAEFADRRATRQAARDA